VKFLREKNFEFFFTFKGLSAPYLATDCLGALFKELRIHATSGEIKLLVLIDKANGLFGKCVVRRPDRTTVGFLKKFQKLKKNF